MYVFQQQSINYDHFSHTCLFGKENIYVLKTNLTFQKGDCVQCCKL